jgi:aquaporin Z
MNQSPPQPIQKSIGSGDVSVRTRAAIEAIGTFILVTTAGVAVFSACPLAAVGVGVVLIVMIYAAGQLAGGHFNAAVTLAVLLRRRIGLRCATVNWLSQIGGGLLGAVAVREIVDPARIVNREGIMLTDTTMVAVFLAELIFAFVLTYAVLGFATGDLPVPTSAHDLAVGVGTLVGAVGVAALSAGAFHAANALRDLATGLFTWSTLWVYLVGQIVAGFFAGIAFMTFGWWTYYEG